MSALTPADIQPGVVVTNGKGRYRLVTRTDKLGTWTDVHYQPAYANAKGQMRRSPQIGQVGLASFLTWSARLATPGERADVIRTLNPKGIE